jgi:hypothetical protein
LTARVHSDRDLSMVGLPALTFGGLPGCEGDPKERFPEPLRPFGVVGWELDQERSRHAPTLLGTSTSGRGWRAREMIALFTIVSGEPGPDEQWRSGNESGDE